MIGVRCLNVTIVVLFLYTLRENGKYSDKDLLVWKKYRNRHRTDRGILWSGNGSVGAFSYWKYLKKYGKSSHDWTRFIFRLKKWNFTWYMKKKWYTYKPSVLKLTFFRSWNSNVQAMIYINITKWRLFLYRG